MSPGQTFSGVDSDLTSSKISTAWYTSLNLGEILKLQEVLEWPSFIHVSSVVCSFIISSEGFYGQILTLFVKILLTSFQQYDDDLCPLGSLTWLDLPEPYLLFTLVNKVTIHL